MYINKQFASDMEERKIDLPDIAGILDQLNKKYPKDVEKLIRLIAQAIIASYAGNANDQATSIKKAINTLFFLARAAKNEGLGNMLPVFLTDDPEQCKAILEWVMRSYHFPKGKVEFENTPWERKPWI